jgi:hypothetical protein
MCCTPPNPTNFPMAVLMLVLNIILPGTGTMLNGCFGRVCCDLIIIGFLQMITAILLVGWIWSIWYGIRILGAAVTSSGHPYHH